MWVKKKSLSIMAWYRPDAGPEVLRHRLIVTYEAEAEELTSEDVIQKIFDHLASP